MVEVGAEVWESVARWLELTGLAEAPERLREPKPLRRAFGTRNSRYTASALDRLRSAGLVKEAVVGDTRYVYLTERACDLLVLLGYVNKIIFKNQNLRYYLLMPLSAIQYPLLTIQFRSMDIEQSYQ